MSSLVQEVKINVIWKEPLEIAGNYNNVSKLPQASSAALYIDYIYLDTEERRRFAQQSHEYLIEQVQFNEDVGISSPNQRIDLTFNHPVKELVWVAHKSTGRTTPNKQWFNYSKDDLLEEIMKDLKNHELELRIEELESKFAKDLSETTFNEIKDLKQHNANVEIVIRSTLPLGACEQIQKEAGNIVYMPEFLRERYWDTDCFKRPLVVGSDNSIPQWLQDEEIKTCSTKEAELVKMYSNNFAVMRIAFANVFYDLAENVGADYNKVLDMYLDIQQDQTYMDVPGHDGTRGFGGKCLPKDLDFLIETLDQKGIDQNWFKHIRELNKGWQKKF